MPTFDPSDSISFHYTTSNQRSPKLAHSFRTREKMFFFIEKLIPNYFIEFLILR